MLLSSYLSTDHILILVHDRTVRQEIFLVANDNNKYQDDIQKIQGRKSLLSPISPIDPFDVQQNASEVLVHKKTFSEQQNQVRNTIARNLLTNESVKSNKVANTGSPKR